DLSKIEAGKLQLVLEPVCVESLCEASLRMIKEAAQKKQIKVCFASQGLINTFQADARRVKQILVNLLSNAVKFTHERGAVGLEVTSHVDPPMLCFTVWDTGIGIERQDLERL